MKLYTEEQVTKAILDCFLSEYTDPVNDILNSLRPIKLPTNSEIVDKIGNSINDEYILGMSRGIHWTIDYIKQQN